MIHESLVGRSQLETQTNLLQKLVVQLQQVQDDMNRLCSSPHGVPTDGAIALDGERTVSSGALKELVDQLEFDV